LTDKSDNGRKVQKDGKRRQTFVANGEKRASEEKPSRLTSSLSTRDAVGKVSPERRSERNMVEQGRGWGEAAPDHRQMKKGLRGAI